MGCRLCGNTAPTALLPAKSGEGYRAAHQIDCPICGTYVASYMFQSVSLSDEERLLLSAGTRKARERGELLELTTGNYSSILRSVPRPTPPEQMNLLLECIERESGPKFEPVLVDPTRHYPIIYARSQKALPFVVDALIKKGLIERDGRSALLEYRVTICMSRFGIVILSPSFFAKEWPQVELDGLTARETATGEKVILPIWHEVSKADVLQYSPTLAGRMAASTANGLDSVVAAIVDVLTSFVGQPAPVASRSLETLSAHELEALRREALRGGQPKCPEDGGGLRLERTTALGMVGEHFFATCPICGKGVDLPGPRAQPE